MSRFLHHEKALSPDKLPMIFPSKSVIVEEILMHSEDTADVSLLCVLIFLFLRTSLGGGSGKALAADSPVAT
eukprot:4254651-Amphidinium_carterae.1